MPNGLPADLFSTGEARWLEVQPAGHEPQPRVLMASVPYALKAADSATLGGLPVSAFVLAGSKSGADVAAVTSAATTANTVTTTGGAAGYIPEFNGASTIVDSPVFISGANVGIGTTTPTAALDVNGTELVTGLLTENGGSTVNGTLKIAPLGTATAASGFDSQILSIYSSTYNSSTKSVVNPRFEFQAVHSGNNSASPTATLQLLSSTTAAGAKATGFSFNTNGTINFAPGQTFPGTGNGTIIGVAAGTGLTGGGTSGNVALNVNENVVAFQSDLTAAEKVLNANIAKAQTAAVSTAESLASSTFLSLASGGTVNGNVIIQGAQPVISTQGNDTLMVTGGSDVQGAGLSGQGISLAAGSGGANYIEDHGGGAGGSISLTAGSGGASNGFGDGPGGNGGSIILRTGPGPHRRR